jgi:hypothetical protein
MEIGSVLLLSPLTEKQVWAKEDEGCFTEVLTLRSNVALAISNEIARVRLENSVCGLGTHPSQHSLEEFRTLLIYASNLIHRSRKATNGAPIALLVQGLILLYSALDTDVDILTLPCRSSLFRSSAEFRRSERCSVLHDWRSAGEPS